MSVLSAAGRRGFSWATGTALVLVGTLALTLAACSDDDMPAASSSGTTPVQADGGGGAPEASASQITPRPDLCASLALGGEAVTELRLRGDAPPPLGGVLAPGTYDLVELNEYAGSASPETDGGEDAPSTVVTGRQAQITIVVTEFELRVIEARGNVGALAAPTTRAMLYRTEGAYLLGTLVCPSTALPATIPYSAAGAGFAIFPDAKHRELYVLRP